MELTTQLLTTETRDDFSALVVANNGVWRGCWRMGFHADGDEKAHASHGLNVK